MTDEILRRMGHVYVEKFPLESHETKHTVFFSLCDMMAQTDPVEFPTPKETLFSRRTVPDSWSDATEIVCQTCTLARLIAKANKLGSANIVELTALLNSQVE